MTSKGNDDSNKQTKVNIKLYAARLKNVAGPFKNSDPYAVATLLAGGPNEVPHVLGKTEVIKSSLNPDWVTQFTTVYTFGKEIKINVGVFDENQHKTMGSAQFEIGEILGARGNIKGKKLKNGGTLFCRIIKAAEEDYRSFQLRLVGKDLKKAEGSLFSLSKPDPFFVLNAQAPQPGGNRLWNQEFRSEAIENMLFLNAVQGWAYVLMVLFVHEGKIL